MNTVEMIAQRRLTREFIRSDAISVGLIRSTQIDSGAGGVKPGPVIYVPPQSFRLVPANSSVFQDLRHKLEGDMPQENFLLIGQVNADIKAGDHFILAGGRYDITYISTERAYETAASVVYRGPET